jgi:hypothetical protein
MGLADEYFHFPAMAPSLETIYQAICEVEGTDVPMEIRRDPSQPVDPQHVDKPGNMELTSDSLKLRGCGQRYLVINVSLDGRTIMVVGNDLDLYKSSCIALTKLGGIPREK